MKKYLFILLFIGLCFGKEQTISDGPYIFIEKNKLIEKNIISSKVILKNLKASSYDTLYDAGKSSFNRVKKIAALSDIHGQYDLLIELLQNNKIIDKNLNWSFGKGHFVIVGDIFDRGDKVNEILWFIYELEMQAKNAGGRVHYLLGNHEYMVLYNDLRYIHEKYNIVSKLLNLEYDQLYGDNTIIGRWLRSKSTIVKINDILFTHGGISEDFISQEGFNINKINNTMRKSIPRLKELRNFRKNGQSKDLYNMYFGSNSLIWYRGYFEGVLIDTDISNILKLVDANHIVVGHTSNKKVVQLYDNKIIGVDSSIKKGKYGELLIIKNKRFFRRTLEGRTYNLN
ncbi:metallophosphoesterase [Candidatus Marinimicrobia bacterium]|nr:metallophosphoesterase [Candidatus Neomarinimicrobiota bacterium]|tara:strand:+ start:3963 stop:4988 length:1026 start_codon:yes stop_codon:yes gene_type:complete